MPNISVKARPSVAGTSRKRAAPYLKRQARRIGRIRFKTSSDPMQKIRSALTHVGYFVAFALFSGM
jgi:hypothetical protein